MSEKIPKLEIPELSPDKQKQVGEILDSISDLNEAIALARPEMAESERLFALLEADVARIRALDRGILATFIDESSEDIKKKEAFMREMQSREEQLQAYIAKGRTDVETATQHLQIAEEQLVLAQAEYRYLVFGTTDRAH